jgi:hypothetical protein
MNLAIKSGEIFERKRIIEFTKHALFILDDIFEMNI